MGLGVGVEVLVGSGVSVSVGVNASVFVAVTVSVGASVFVGTRAAVGEDATVAIASKVCAAKVDAESTADWVLADELIFPHAVNKLIKDATAKTTFNNFFILFVLLFYPNFSEYINKLLEYL